MTDVVTGDVPPTLFEIDMPPETDIFAGYERERSRGSIFWHEQLQAWAVLSYETCVRVERDEVLFAHPDRPDIVGDDEVYKMIQLVVGGERGVLLVQGEKHLALHGAIARELVLAVRRARPQVLELVSQYVSSMPDRLDFRSEVADLLPTAVISSMMELPWVDDRAALTRARDLVRDVSAARQTLERDSDKWRRGQASARILDELLMPIVRQREGSQDGDLISRMWIAGADVYDDWSAADVLAQCRVLFFAGSASSAELLSNITYVLATKPDLFAALKNEPKHIPTFLEEILRLVSPVQARPRIATEDVVLEGQPIPRGSVIYCFNGAANRDPAKYACPHAMQIEGAAQRHIAFNTGPRTCVGSPIARLEGQVFIRAMVDQMASIGLDPEAPRPQFVGHTNFGFAPLHIVLERS
jgi:cytochrome P450